MSDTPDAAAAKTPRKQMNVRMPEDLIAQIDARRIRKGGLSRDVFVERALRFALVFKPESGTAELDTPQGRTAPPPHRRK